MRLSKISMWTVVLVSLSVGVGTTEATEPSPSALPVPATARLMEAGALSVEMGQLGLERPELKQLRRIVIDPGHGGTNEGALGVGGVYEKHLVLGISLHLVDTLRERYPNLEVALTRTTDVDVALADRIGVANAWEADLFISVHLNAAVNPEAVGVETYWIQDRSPILPPGDLMLNDAVNMLGSLPTLAQERKAAAKRAHTFADLLQAEMVSSLRATNRGVKRGNYTVLRRAMVPAVVVELGFLSHEKEGAQLMSPKRQAKLVDALVRGIELYDAHLNEQASD